MQPYLGDRYCNPSALYASTEVDAVSDRGGSADADRSITTSSNGSPEHDARDWLARLVLVSPL